MKAVRASSLVVFTAHPNTEPRRFNIHGASVTSLAFLVDGKHIVGGCEDGTIRRWNVGDQPHGIEMAMKSDDAVKSITVSSDGKWIVSGGVDCKVMVWDAMDPNVDAPVKQFEIEASITTLDISPDSSRIAVGLENGAVFIWGLESGKRLVGPLKHPESRVSSVKFSPIGDRLASACPGWDCDSIRVWNSRTGAQLTSLSADTEPTYSVAWSRDGQRLFAGGPFGALRCFDIADGTISSRFGGHFSDFVTTLCISNNSRFLIAASASCHSLSLWDVQTFQEIQPNFFLQPSEAVAISLDDQHLVATMDGKLSIWNLHDILPTTLFFHRLAPCLKDSEPFTYMGQAVHDSWINGKLQETEEALSEEITNPDKEYVAYSLANRALVRARLEQWDEALEDARMSTDSHLTLVSHIANGVILFRKGNRPEAMEAFDFALGICENTRPFVELTKQIIMFEAGKHDEVESICLDPDCTQNIRSLRSAVKARMLAFLAEYSMKEQQFAKAVEILQKAEALVPFTQVPELTTITLIFGWKFDDGLESKIQQQKCIALSECGSMREAILSFLAIQGNLEAEVENRKEMSEWFSDFRKRCLEASEHFGEDAMHSKSYTEALTYYSAALQFGPASPEQVLVKRSEVYAAMDMWEMAMSDANEVIKRNSSLPSAYAMKCCALQNLERYDEITGVYDGLPDELRNSYKPVKEAIDKAIEVALRDVPFRMIDTETGNLYQASGLRRMFERSPSFWRLVAPDTKHTDPAWITHIVGEFFQYVMFSHRWQNEEPRHNHVESQSVYSLRTQGKPSVVKLQTFCRTAREAGYRWAWSDTVCINQADQQEFQESIHSMFTWYHRSSLTIVYLWDVLDPSAQDGMKGSKWFTRGWTLQELLAPTVIRFFTANWKLCPSDSPDNHKKSAKMMEEIAGIVGVPANELLSFHPSAENVRWKLHMASQRETTIPRDSAYCLWGIFDVFMPVVPAEPRYHAVGRLLQEIIARSQSGDVGCLAWVGEPSKLNSCLPTKVEVYQEACHTPSSIKDQEIQDFVSVLASSFSSEDQTQALALFDKLERLRRAQVDAGWRLHLPCITFHVTAFDMRHRGSSISVYTAKADELDTTTICTSAKMLPKKDLLLVCPWIHELIDLPLHDHQDVEAGFPSAFHRPSETLTEPAVHETDEPIRSQAHTPDQSDRLNVPEETTQPSTPPSVPTPSPSPLPSPLPDERTKALRFVARLRQPMTALLLAPRPRGAYKRVATDQEIIVQLREEVSLDSMSVEELEII